MNKDFRNLQYNLWRKQPQKKLVKRLRELNLKITVAESCTGGLLAKKITDVPGASKVFEYGFCTYSNAAKIKILGVSGEVLERYSAVSKETAFEMVKGAKKISGADVAVSVTGYAGSKTERHYNQNVGLIFIGIAFEDSIYSVNLDFRESINFDRKTIRRLSVKHAISAVLALLNSNTSS